MISADAVREHLQSLSAAGVGYRSVADACGISEHTVLFLHTGRRGMVHTSTAARILGVDQDARADKALIPSGPTMALIKELTGDGYTQRQLAGFIGRKHLWLGRSGLITARVASEIERLYRRIQDGRVQRAG